MAPRPDADRAWQAGRLARWASDPAHSRGRRHPEGAAWPRSEFQRDRDRIVHSTAFRRLVYKTQVFVNHEGDLYRTRMTHSLEVAQLSRSMARALALNEDLVEAIALAHDLGHTPFGHAGQDALHGCMADHGGFEHNLQSLRVVDLLEQRYPAFDGLNLCLETREGILKRCSRAAASRLEAAEPQGVAHRFVAGLSPSLEAQLVNLADELAYNAHDVDDGVRAGLIDVGELCREVPLFERHHRQALVNHPQLADLPPRRHLFEAIRLMLSAQLFELIDTTRGRLERDPPADAAELRRRPELVGFESAARAEVVQLKRFLFERLYRHPQVESMTARAREVVRDLWAIYSGHPEELPAEHRGDDLARCAADYLAGMTDRFALREHHRLTGRRVFDEG